MKTLVIDAPFLCHRAIHTMGALSFENQNTGVIFGFLMQVLSFAKEHKTNDVIFCWDSRNSKRKEFFSGYKSGRKSIERTPEEEELLRQGFLQFQVLQDEVLPALGFNNIYAEEGIEADDLIATTVMYHEKEFIIISADQDMYQLLDFADIYNPSNKKLFTYKDFTENFEIYPEFWIEVKTIAGCSSDSIPGVPGVGEKTAIKFLREDLSLKSKKYQDIKKFLNSQEYVRNQTLVTLPYKGTPIFPIKENTFDIGMFLRICTKFSFDSFTIDPYFLRWKNFFNGEF